MTLSERDCAEQSSAEVAPGVQAGADTDRDAELKSVCCQRLSRAVIGHPTRSQYAWMVYDWADSIYTIAQSLLLPPLVTDLAEAAGYHAPKAVWLWASTTATVLSLVAYLTFCSVGEYALLKNTLARACALLGAVFIASASLAVVPWLFWWAALAFVFSKVLSRVSSLFMDALLFDVCGHDEHTTHNVSAKATTVGYIAMFVFTLLIGPLLVAENVLSLSPTTAVWVEARVPIVLVGLWWGGFTVVAFRYMGRYPGRDLPEGVSSPSSLLRFAFTRGVRENLDALRSMADLRDVTLFLVGWMFLSDASSTATSTAVLIARRELDLSTTWIGAATAIGLVAAALGMQLFRALVRARLLAPKSVLLINIVCLSCVAASVLLMTKRWHALVLSALAGLNVGSVNSFTRSMLAAMIPHGRQTNVFAVYEITQKGTSWIGPLVIATLLETFGDSGFRYIVVATVLSEVVLGLPFFLLVDTARAARVAKENSLPAAGAAAEATPEATKLGDGSSSQQHDGAAGARRHQLQHAEDGHGDGVAVLKKSTSKTNPLFVEGMQVGGGLSYLRSQQRLLSHVDQAVVDEITRQAESEAPPAGRTSRPSSA